MPGYWDGLISGFQERRLAEDERNYQRELGNRERSDRVFNYLLQSRDPLIQEMALDGLMNPLSRSKGFAGFLGNYESNPMLAKIVGLMNQQVPDTSAPASPAPAAGQSAAMSTNQPVKLGSQPLPTPPPTPPDFRALAPPPMLEDPDAPLPLETGFGEGPAEILGRTPAIPEPPRFKRRGTGVPTAEEIAEMTAESTLRGRMHAASGALQGIGATGQEVEDALMGIAGAPRSQRNFAAPTFGVMRPGTDYPVPVSFDYSTGKFFFTDGSVVPADAQMVRMTGSSGSGAGSLTSTVRDSPEVRAQYGIEPSEVTPTGYWKIKQAGDGSVVVMPTEFTPPPAYTGTVDITDPNLPGVTNRFGINRGGGLSRTPLGSTSDPQASQTQLQAKALIASVDAAVSAERANPLTRFNFNPQRIDQIVQQQARAQGLPYQSYAQLQQAAIATPQVSPEVAAAGGSLGERLRRRALGGGGGDARPPVRPARPGSRATGPGPVGAP